MVSREEVLAAIRRCASENDGRPLGRKRFEAKTGIRESDWIGRYWTRWGDAIAEAGLEPNALQDIKYDEAALIQHLVALIRKLGRFPTQAEMRMQRRSDPTFPSWNVFGVRLGNRAEMVARIRAYAEERRDLDDVTAALGSEVPELPGAEVEDAGPAGYVYLMRSGHFYKIGRANHPGRRHYEVGLQLPEAVKLVHVIATDDPTGIEGYWHRRFASKRMNGEWFRLTRQDVEAFKQRKIM